ncbi:MAG: hypothetical protein ACQ9ET_03740 [Nitrosomonadaceae bacterium]
MADALSSADIQKLADAIKSSTSGSMSGGSVSNSTPSMSREEMAVNSQVSKAMKDTSKAMKIFEQLANKSSKTAEEAAVQMKMSSRLINDAIDKADFNEVSRMPSILQDALRESNSQYAKDLAATVEDLGDVLKVEQSIQAQRDLIETLEKLKKGPFDSAEWDKATAQAKKYGVALDDNMIGLARDGKLKLKNDDIINQLTESQKDLEEQTSDLSEAMVKAAKKMNAGTGKFGGFMNKLGIFGKIIGLAIAPMKMFVDEQRAAMKYGLADNILKVATAAVDLGMAVPEMKEIQAANRQISYALGGMDELHKMWVGASNALQPIVGTREEASKIAMKFASAMADTGIAAGDLSAATMAQVQIYDDHYRMMGLSAEQFAQFTQDLVADTEFRHSLARLKKEERRGYVEGVQLRMAENRQMGYTLERTKDLQKYFAQISGADSPMERMQKAARMGSMFGALGMGQEGQRINDLMRKMPSMGRDEQIAAQKEITKLNEKAANLYFKKLGSSEAENATFQTLGMNTGFHEIASKFETATVEARKFEEKKAKEEYERQRRVHGAISTGVDFLDKIASRTGNSVALLTAIAGSTLGGKLFGKVAGAIGGGAGGKDFATLMGGTAGLGAVLGLDNIVHQSREEQNQQEDAQKKFTKTQNDAMYAHIAALLKQGEEHEDARRIAIAAQIKVAQDIKGEVAKQGEIANEHEEEKKRKHVTLVPVGSNYTPPPVIP